MKKLIITSICTLALSLFSTIGAKQDTQEIVNDLNTNNVNINEIEETTEVENEVNKIEEVETTVSDNATVEKDIETVDKKDTTEDEKNEVQIKNNEDKKEVKAAKVSDNSNNKAAPVQKKTGVTVAKKEAVEAEVKKAEAPEQKAAVKETVPVTNSEAKKVPQKTNADTSTVKVDNFGLKNGQVILKNIDLSNCETTQDVVNELQKNGYTNITSKNIQNIDSLEDILATIENKTNNQKSAAKTPAPTKAPSYTEPKAPSKVDTKTPSNTGTKTPTNTNTNTGLSAYANQVLQLVNQERAKAGLSAFTTAPALTNAANKRAQEIVQSFSHTRPNGTSFSTALKEYGVSYRTSGENIAWGQKSAQEVVTGWMNSPGHRANILNGNFNKIGIGVYQSNGRLYWTQLFTN